MDRHGWQSAPWPARWAARPSRCGSGCAKLNGIAANVRVSPARSARDSINALERESREPRRANEILLFGLLARDTVGSPASEPRRANEILPFGLGVFRAGGARPPTEVMVAFLDTDQGSHRVEPIRAQWPIAPSVTFRPTALGRPGGSSNEKGLPGVLHSRAPDARPGAARGQTGSPVLEPGAGARSPTTRLIGRSIT